MSDGGMETDGRYSNETGTVTDGKQQQNMYISGTYVCNNFTCVRAYVHVNM